MNSCIKQNRFNNPQYPDKKIRNIAVSDLDSMIDLIWKLAELQDILEKFDFRRQISRLQSSNLLYPLLKAFENVDLHPAKISPHDMGYIFEDLIRRFNEQDNQTAGEHFTPREVIELM